MRRAFLKDNLLLNWLKFTDKVTSSLERKNSQYYSIAASWKFCIFIAIVLRNNDGVTEFLFSAYIAFNLQT